MNSQDASGSPGVEAEAAAGPRSVWILALGTTVGMQTVASFLDQTLAVVGPLLTAGLGVASERIGYVSSLSALGVVLFLLFGTPLLARFGSIRMLQVGAATAILGLSLAATRWWPAVLIAPILLGMGYGPTPPAGSRILAKTAPPKHRSLIFSIKQAGAPAGGALAGLLLAPVAAAWGWPAALATSVAIGATAAILLERVRPGLDSDRDPSRAVAPRDLFRPASVAAPFRTIGADPAMMTVTALAISFAIVQGSLFSFSVTYLVVDRHLGLAEAGFAYACLQLAGVVARIGLGWIADRTGRAARNLAVQALVAAGLVCVYAALPDRPALPIVVAAAAATGFFAASWNGIFMAEIARLAPADQVVEATASSALLTFVGYMAGPTVFSLLVTGGGYRAAFLAIAGQLAVMAIVQLGLLRRAGLRGPIRA